MLTTGNDLVGLLGSFWRTCVSNKNLIHRLLGGVALTQEELDVATAKFMESVSAKDITPGVVVPWSTVELSPENVLQRRYGRSNVYYGGETYFGDKDPTLIAYSIDPTIIELPFLYASLSDPAEVLTSGIDYVLEQGVLIFKQAPSRSTYYARNAVKEAGYVSTQLGYGIQITASDELYRRLQFANIWRLYTYGPSFKDFYELLAQACEVPLFKRRARVQEVIRRDFGTYVLTEDDVYFIPARYNPTVVKYRWYNEGESMCDGLKLLHNKQPILTPDLVLTSRELDTYTYGRQRYAADSLVIVQASVVIPAGALLSLLRNLLPVEVGIMVLASKKLAAPDPDDVGAECTPVTMSSRQTGLLLSTQGDVEITAKAKRRFTYGL